MYFQDRKDILNRSYFFFPTKYGITITVLHYILKLLMFDYAKYQLLICHQVQNDLVNSTHS